jgi:nitrite reductase (NO-forming)
VWKSLVLVAAFLMFLPVLALSITPIPNASAQDAPSLSIVSPTDGSAITTNDIIVQVEVSNFTVDCSQLGRPDQDGVGQILAFVDGATVAQLTNFYCGDTFVIPGNGLTPGQHQIAIVLASNTHVPNMDTAQAITIDFQPVQPVPLPVANDLGAPAITLVSPLDGATVPSVFEVQVQTTNFVPANGLEGKANVLGYGHYHVWVDAPDMPTSLANLVLMPGTNAFTLDLSAWGPGEHQIRIETAQNDHSMYDPATPASFTVNVDENATPVTADTSAPATAAATDAGALTVELVDIAFNPTEFTIPADQDVVVTLTNNGASAHNFSITDHENANVANLNISVDVAAGETTTVTINAPAGDYYFFCNVPGHEAAGMSGTLHVQ